MIILNLLYNNIGKLSTKILKGGILILLIKMTLKNQKLYLSKTIIPGKIRNINH